MTMKIVPILALGAVAATYFAATDRLEARFAAPPLTAYAADTSPQPSVYHLLDGTGQPFDEPHCAPHAQLAANLTHDFAERPVENRFRGDGLEMQLWASTLMGTWTLVHLGSDGIACIVTSGTGWTDAASPDDVFLTAPLAS
jgi:hypothetical protein